MADQERQVWVHFLRSFLLVLIEYEKNPLMRELYVKTANELPLLFGIDNRTAEKKPGGAPRAWQEWTEILKKKGIRF